MLGKRTQGRGPGGGTRAGVLHKTTTENLLVTIKHLKRLNVQVTTLLLI